MTNGTTRQSRGKHRAPTSRQRGLALKIAAAFVAVAAVAYIAFSLFTGDGPLAPKDWDSAGDGTVQMVQIEEGMTLSHLAPELAERGIVRTGTAFLSAAQTTPAASKILPGYYRLQGHMSGQAAVDALLNPENKVEPLKVPGGATLFDVEVWGGQKRLGILSQIEKLSCGSASENCATMASLVAAAESTPVADLGVPEWARAEVSARGKDARRLEGLIASGEYVVAPDESAQEILTDLITRSAQTYEKTGIAQRAEKVGLSPYELLTAASLVEREAPAGAFDRVARVILNRLAAPMRLQFDSTVNYGLPKQEVQTNDEDRQRVTPWNTYAKDGLPETPIASPSVKAIDAMENPADGNWLYFVTIDANGTTVFNDTYDAHLRDVQRAQESGILDSKQE